MTCGEQQGKLPIAVPILLLFTMSLADDTFKTQQSYRYVKKIFSRGQGPIGSEPYERNNTDEDRFKENNLNFLTLSRSCSVFCKHPPTYYVNKGIKPKEATAFITWKEMFTSVSEHSFWQPYP